MSIIIYTEKIIHCIHSYDVPVYTVFQNFICFTWENNRYLSFICLTKIILLYEAVFTGMTELENKEQKI